MSGACNRCPCDGDDCFCAHWIEIGLEAKTESPKATMFGLVAPLTARDAEILRKANKLRANNTAMLFSEAIRACSE